MKVALALLAVLLVQLAAADWTAVKVTNRGAYVARFSVKYINNGEINEEQTNRFEVGQSRSLEVPPSAVSVLVKVENDIFFGVWSTIFTVNLPKAETKCYVVTGTTLHPGWREADC